MLINKYNIQDKEILEELERESTNTKILSKTALLLSRKCRILMAQSGSEKTLDSLFYEADTVFIGAKSKEMGNKVVLESNNRFCLF